MLKHFPKSQIVSQIRWKQLSKYIQQHDLPLQNYALNLSKLKEFSKTLVKNFRVIVCLEALHSK